MKKRYILLCFLFFVALLGFILRSPPAGSGFIADAPPPDEHAAVFPEPSELVEVPVEDSLRNAASGEAGGRAAFTVESEVQHHRFPGREALRAGDETISERWLDEEVRSALEAEEGEARLGRRERIVLRESFKHPLLRRVEEVYPGPDGARRVRVLRETVADHVVVRLRPQADIEAVVAALADEGVLLRHSARAGNIHTLAFAIDDAERHVRLLRRLKHDPRVAVADEDDLYYALDEPEPPNDPDFPVLWGLHNTGQDSYAEGRPPGTPGADIDALRAWQRTTGSSDVIIAVIDGGIDYTHEDLAANMWVNPDPDAPDRHGYDFFDDDPDPMPTNNNDGHGTHVAGTIGAVGNNSIGVTGVNWQTRIMALRFLGPGGGTSADGAAAMHYAIDNGAHIVNNSWGGTQSNTVLEDAISRANDEEVLMVMAAGNDGSNNDLSPRYPANYDFPNVITVAASDRNDRRAGFSNYGIGSVHLAAPGVEIASTFPNNAYRRTDGTSMAAPHVAGVAGLIASYLGTDTPATRLRQIILDNVDPIDSLRPRVSTGGRLNAHESLAGIVTAPFSGHARLSFDDSQHGGNNDGYLNPGERILSTLHVIHYGETAVSGLTASLSVVSGGEVITLNDGSHTISELSPGGSYVFADAFDFTIAETVPETPHTVTFSLSITDGSETWSRQVSAVIRDVFTLEGTVLLDDSPFPTTDEVRIEYRGPVEGFLTPEADGSYSLNLPQGAYEVRAVLRDSFHYEEYLGDWVYGSAWTLVDGFVEGSVVHDVRFQTGYLRGRVSSFPGVGIAHASVKTEWAFPWNEDYYTVQPGDFLYRTPYRYQYTHTDEHGDYEIAVIVPEGETAEMRKAIFSHRAYGATETGESLSFVLPETELNATLYAGSINMERPDITLIVPPDSVSSHSLRLYNTGTRAETVFITDTMPYYSWETMSYTWLELNQGTGTRVEAWDYDESIRNSEDMVTSERKQHRISLGFDMPYYQGTASTVYVHADGWLSLRGPDPSLKLGVHLGNGVPYTSGDRERPDVIAPLWMDWTVNDGRFLENLYYHQPDSDTLILQWDRRIGDTVYSYQAWLHRDGRIHFVYKNLPEKSITDGFLGYAGISDRWCGRGITLERSNSTVHPWSVLGNNTRIGFTPQPAWLNTHSARTQIQADDWHEIQFSVDSTGKAIGDYEAFIYAMFSDNRAIQRAAGSEWQADASLRIRLKVREGDELIADAGPDRRLRLGTAITLDGRASIGPQPLTYTWAQIDGPGPTLPLTHSDQAQAFIALGPDGMENPAVFGSYTFELTVNDGEGSASDTVTVEVLPRNVALNKPVVATSGTVFTYRPGNRDHEDFWQALPRVEAITDGYFEREGWINFWAGKAEAGDGGSKPRIWFEIDLEGTYQLHEAAIYYEIDSVMASFDDCWIEYKGTDGVWRLLTPKWRRGGWPRPEWVDTFADYPPIEGGPVTATAVRMIQEVAAASAVLVIRDFQLYGMRLSEYDTEPNTPPVAQSADYEVDQEASVQIELLASDADDDRLTYSLVSQPGHGSLHGSPPHLLYKPDPGYHGSDAFSFLASDGQALSNIATIRITVHPVAHPPVAVDDRARTIPGEAVAVEVLLNDRSRDNRPLQVLSVGTPGHGSVNLVNGNVHYTPHEDWQGLDSFTYTIADDRDLQSSAEIHIFTGDPLVAHLPLEEDALDITDYEHHGSLDGASIEAGWGLGGGGALRILAEDQALQVAADGALTEDTLHRRSVAWWMNLDQLRVEGREQILYQEGNGSDADAPFLEVAVDSTGRLRARISDPAWPEGQQQPALEYGLVSQSWQHVAVVFDGSDSGAPGSLSLYLDGERIDHVTVGNALAARNGFVHFANDGAREQAALGRFNDLRIYDWALTPPEVAEIASFDPPPGFTLTYEANGGEGAVPAALTAPAGQNLVLPGPGGMSKPGHAFNGWRDVPGAVTYAAGDTLVMPARDFTLAAQWTVQGGSGDAVAIYHEAFLRTNTPSGNRLLNESWAAAGHYKGNWRVYDAQGNTPNTGATGTGAGDRGRMVSNGVAATNQGGDGNMGFIYLPWGSANATANRRDDVNHGIVFRDETPVFNSGGDITAAHREWQNLRGFSVDLSRGTNASTATAGTRAVIQIGTDWFASATTLNPAATNTWETHSIAYISTENWLTLSFDPANNNRVTLGATAQTLSAHGASGSLTSVGFHLSNTSDGSANDHQYRIDNIVVTAVGGAAPGDGHTVTYDAGGGSGSAPVDGNQYAAGSTVTVMGQGNVTRAGFTFTGWHDGTTLRQPLDTFSMPDANVTLTAHWSGESQTYTVTFLNYDASVLKMEQVESGQSATAPADPVRAGYTFTGWDVPFDTITGDLTVTAQWEPIPEPGDWILQDDFETYTAGSAPGSPWTLSGSGMTVEANSFGNSGQFLANEGESGATLRRALTDAIPNDSTAATLFYRFRSSVGSENQGIGLTDAATPSRWNDFRVQINVVNNVLTIRDGGEFRDFPIAGNTWHRLWVVVNNSANTYRIYLQGGSFENPTLVEVNGQSTFAFRTNSSGALTTLFSRVGEGALSPVYYDDIYLALDENLTLPAEDFDEVEEGWRSDLYPEDWQSPTAVNFFTDPFLQDFSYAGYQRGEQPLPAVTEPVFDVTDPAYGADPSGASDSTAAIQVAIDAAVAAGGGVVYLPAGTYRVAPVGGNPFALRIQANNIVLRGAGVGETHLLNTATDMRQGSVILVEAPSGGNWRTEVGTPVAITADLMGPSRVIPVASTGGFNVGDWVVLRCDLTPELADDLNMGDLWNTVDRRQSLGGMLFYRQVTAIDAENSTLEVDAPTRFALLTRDNARVAHTVEMLEEVGLEQFSIGNLQHSGTTGWGENDFNNSSHPAYQVHSSQLITWRGARNSWMQSVHSYRPPANTKQVHMLSNGVVLHNTRGLTLRDVSMERAQYGGGGGNGYMIRMSSAQETLVQDSRAAWSRHGFVFSGMQTSGNVIHRGLAEETKWSAEGTTNGSGSDHHMHFSQSNLIDTVTVDRDYFEAAWRGTWGTIPHGMTATHTTYWNLEGLRYGPDSQNTIIHTEQFAYGYVIGTRGPAGNVLLRTNQTSRTDPADIIEGVGMGDLLHPFSLYEDQLARRLDTPLPPNTVLYVNHAASGGNNGTSWGDAFSSLRDALAAAQSGQEIWVAAGSYRPFVNNRAADTFLLPSGVALYGGFAGTESERAERNWLANETILSGHIEGQTNIRHIVTATGAEDTRIDGFTIRDGHSDGENPYSDGVGAAVSVGEGEGRLTLANCRIVDNHAQEGGVVYFDANANDPSLRIENTVFAGNSIGSEWARGILQIRSNAAEVWLEACHFVNNPSGIFSEAGHLQVLRSQFIAQSGIAVDINYHGARNDFVNCVFDQNGGGAIRMVNSQQLRVANCVFARNGNPAMVGGALNISQGRFEVYNSTLFDNSADEGAAIAWNYGWAGDESSLIHNSIFWGNTGDNVILLERYNTDDVMTLELRNNLLQGGAASVATWQDPVLVLENLIDSDPLFVDTSDLTGPDGVWGTDDDGLRLQAASPAVNTGLASLLPADWLDVDANGDLDETLPLDLLDTARVFGAHPSPGAYEQGTPFEGWLAEHYDAGTEPDDDDSRGGMSLTVRQVWLAGLTPNGDDVFRIVGINNDHLPIFEPDLGASRVYSLQWTDDLTDVESWRNAADPVTPMPSSGQVFFRIQVLHLE